MCYYDLEAKPLDVIKGTVEGTSERAGSMPDLEHIGVPIKPATPDVTPQVTQILDFDPDVIIFSAQGADCWNLVDGLGRLGWTPDAIPLVLSGACVDFDAMRAAGELANGIYFVTAGGSNTNDLDAIENPRERAEAEVFQTKPIEYGLSETDLFKGFGAGGFNSMMGLWAPGQPGRRRRRGGDAATSLREYVAATDERAHVRHDAAVVRRGAGAVRRHLQHASTPSPSGTATNLVPVQEDFSGADLVAGTELRPGP